MVDLSSLNANQLEAVNWNDGPLLVLAGPGSGKTRVLTYRIARIVEETPNRPFRILGLTFTNRAASEMRIRVEQLVPNARGRILLTTFHSFCADLLRQHGHHIGLRPDFTILSQTVDREAVLNDAIEAARMEHADFTHRGDQLLPMVDRLLDNCISADDALEDLTKQQAENAVMLAKIYANYRGLMIENNYLDFGGLIAETLSLLEQNTAVQRLTSRIYPYVCVDEFQDTNLAQYRVLSNIVDPINKNLFVVADDDQIIYQWNGADPERLRSLRADFDMPVLQLPENYRCPPEVVEVANRLIQHNLSHDPEKFPLVANKEAHETGFIRIKSFEDLENEADWIASDIVSRPVEEWGECVVLARSRRLLESALKALDAYEVQAHIAMRKNEFTTNQMIWLHSVLRLANARQDREQLRRICKSFFELAGINLQLPDIISDAASNDGDYLRAWQRAATSRSQMDHRTKQFLHHYMPVLSDRLDFWTFAEAAFQWFDELPEVGPESEHDESEFSEEKATWYELVTDVVIEFGRDLVTLNVLLQELDLRSKTPVPSKGSVPLYTIHLSKGTEFRHVYLMGMVEDQLPSWYAVRKGPASREMQEERRNCFVAITRVQDSLTLTASRSVFGWTKNPSRFLTEMGLIGN